MAQISRESSSAFRVVTLREGLSRLNTDLGNGVVSADTRSGASEATSWRVDELIDISEAVSASEDDAEAVMTPTTEDSDWDQCSVGANTDSDADSADAFEPAPAPRAIAPPSNTHEPAILASLPSPVFRRRLFDETRRRRIAQNARHMDRVRREHREYVSSLAAEGRRMGGFLFSTESEPCWAEVAVRVVAGVGFVALLGTKFVVQVAVSGFCAEMRQLWCELD
jgi:hypothetical protein